MAQRDEFVTEMIVIVVMLTRLDKNINKISFSDVNVINFLLDENVNIFYWRKVLVIFLDLNVNIGTYLLYDIFLTFRLLTLWE